MKKISSLLFLILFICPHMHAEKLKWFNPQKSQIPCIQGQAWSDEIGKAFVRLPNKAQNSVRKEVWDLSRYSAGLAMHFYSNAPTIQIKYSVKLGWDMDMMPNTGAAGLDLYSIDKNGNWNYIAPEKRIWTNDTIIYNYTGIESSSEKEFRIYLPPYRNVDQMVVGVPDKNSFKVVPVRNEKPIVIYGTSIVQGGCVSRPAMTWSNILSRRLDQPIINLGFAGNGKLEREVLSFVKEISARIYILDCLPNLSKNSFEEVKTLIVDAVEQIREDDKSTPILLTEYATPIFQGRASEKEQKQISDLNRASKAALEILQQKNTPNLYYLTCDEINMPVDATVEGVHPTDYGMTIIANAYEKKLREILKEPLGNTPTTIPVTQRREPNIYEWQTRHSNILKENAKDAPQNVILGNSIIHYWGGATPLNRQHGKKSWSKYMEKAGFRNMGCGWDRIANVLWRVYHGELDGFDAKKIILAIGTNDLENQSDEEITEGIVFLMKAIRGRQPNAKLFVLGILPRRGLEYRVALLNKKLEQRVKVEGFGFADAGYELLTEEAKVNEKLFSDGLHPNEKGYEKIAKSISEIQ